MGKAVLDHEVADHFPVEHVLPAPQITKSALTTCANVITDLRSIVQNWASGVWADYGFCFTSSDYTFANVTSFAFFSVEDAAGGKPQLTVVCH